MFNRLSIKHIFFYLLLLTSHFANAVNLNDIYQYLYQNYPQYSGITYNEPDINYLESGKWILQTSAIWVTSKKTYNESFIAAKGEHIDPEFGVATCHVQSDCGGVGQYQQADFTLDSRKLCLTPAFNFVSRLYSNIINAHESVDITNLGEGSPTEGAFTAVLKNALTTLGTKSQQHPIIVRILEGSAIPFTVTQVLDAQSNDNGQSSRQILIKYFSKIISGIPTGTQLKVYITNEESCRLQRNCGNYNDQDSLLLMFSYAHGKFVMVDGRQLITGGEA